MNLFVALCYIVYFVYGLKKHNVIFLSSILNFFLLVHFLYILFPVVFGEYFNIHFFDVYNSNIDRVNFYISVASFVFLVIVYVLERCNVRYGQNIIFTFSPYTKKIAFILYVFCFMYFVYINAKYLPQMIVVEGFERRKLASLMYHEKYWIFANLFFFSTLVLYLSGRFDYKIYLVSLVFMTFAFVLAGSRFEIIKYYIFTFFVFSVTYKTHSLPIKKISFVSLLMIVYFMMYVPLSRMSTGNEIGVLTVLSNTFGEFIASRFTFEIALNSMVERGGIGVFFENAVLQLLPGSMRWGDLINVDSLLVPYYSDYVASVGGLASNVLNEGWYLGELYGLMFLLLVMFIYFLIFWAINNHATSFVMYFSSVYMISNVFTFYRQSFVGAEIYILVVFVVTSLWIKSSLYRVIDARLPASHQTNHTIDKKWHDSLQQGEQHERKQTQ